MQSQHPSKACQEAERFFNLARKVSTAHHINPTHKQKVDILQKHVKADKNRHTEAHQQHGISNHLK